MINNTCDFERMSFMDDSLGYSQIKMHPDDEKHTSFWMLFGCVLLHDNVIWLEECGYNQQCAMSIISCDHIRKTVECYVDDIKIKSHTKNNHLHDLRMMLISCGLTSWRWTRQSPSWEFQVASSHLDPDKIRAIQVMQLSRNFKYLKGLQSRLAYIQRFNTNRSSHCQLFTQLMKNGVSFIWDDTCQKAFDDIKKYLTRPSVLAYPISKKLF